MTMINVKKVLESNLPTVDEDFTMSFTEEGNLYYNKNDGSQLKVSDLMSGYKDEIELQSKNPALKDKLYLTSEYKLYIYDGVEYKEISPSQETDIDFDYENAQDLKLKNPAKRDKLYITKDGNMYLYDGAIYVAISGGGGGGGGSIDGVKQITRLNVTAPHTTTIPIDFTSSFDKLPLEVLKVDAGSQGVVETLADFDNGERSDFEENKYIEFDGVAKLKTEYEFPVKWLYNGVYEFDFAELDQFKITNDMWITISKEGHAELDSGGTKIDSNLSSKATIGKSEGKWYWEVKKFADSDYQFYGISDNGLVETMHDKNVSGYYTTVDVDSARYLHLGNEDTSIDVSEGIDAEDIVGIALDMDGDTIEFYKNGVKLVEQPIGFKPSDIGDEVYPVITSWQKTNFKKSEINLGSTIFEYDVPKGYLPYNYTEVGD